MQFVTKPAALISIFQPFTCLLPPTSAYSALSVRAPPLSLRARERADMHQGRQHKSVHTIPVSEEIRVQWINFIYNGNVPARVGKKLLVCANHFTSDCFKNLGQYSTGLAQKLLLIEGAVPTIRCKTTDTETASTSGLLDRVHHVACQTDPPTTRSFGTQLSMKTLQPHFRSTGTQKTVSCTDVGVGTSALLPFLTSTPIKRPSKRRRLELEEEEEENPLEGSSVDVEEPHDSTYDPADSATTLTESADVTMESSTPVHKTPTYIVYENCLMELFQVCPVCQRECDMQKRRLGTFLSVEQRCPHCEFYRKWNSQPLVGSTPAGNLQLSTAVYATGASFFKLEKIFRAMQLKMFQYDSFRRHARMYIEPAIVHRWKTAQTAMLEQLSQLQNVVLGGDLRADSPGHCAKFGSYTMMDMRSNTVIDLQLVQSNEVGGSYHMEKEGLKRSLALLEERGVTIDSIVTDRHPQIQKFLREADVTHYYDVWHMEKGLSKKLSKISQNKECEKLKKWLQSIKNHIYWTAASSTSVPERTAKWMSILNHVRDIHNHEDPVFPQCLHPTCTSRDKSKWLTTGTPAFCRLEKVLSNKRVLKDVGKLSPHYQTSSLESFHSVILRFAPKNVVFPFLGMLCR
uniref:THAP-type domain-containing protein n=1 Tax=Dicentrarchus labrax TaxID=13489 RepID=A0A8P4G5H1_DICLA